MTGHTPWSEIRHRALPWWRFIARFRVRRYRKMLRKMDW